MTRRRIGRMWWSVALGVLAAAAGEAEILVSIDGIDPFAPASKQVEILAWVAADEAVASVEFWIDGMHVAETPGHVSNSPYRIEVDLGDQLEGHQFRVVAVGISGAIGSAELTTPGIRIDEKLDFNLRQLYATITREGEPALDLRRRDFEVFDGGARQQIVTFARGDIPFTAVVLADASLSMWGDNLAIVLKGARSFFDGMQPLDEGRLLVFSDRILLSTPFTTYPRILTAGLDGVRSRGGTAISDHLYLALEQLEERQGRRVVVLLSDGADSHSVLSMKEVLEKSRRCQALVYWLSVPHHGAGASGSPPTLTSSWRSSEEFERGYELLTRMVEESGGRVVPVAPGDDLGGVFVEILTELRKQYALGYYPSTARHDGRWRKVRLRALAPDLVIRTRGGYVDH